MLVPHVKSALTAQDGQKSIVSKVERNAIKIREREAIVDTCVVDAVMNQQQKQ